MPPYDVELYETEQGTCPVAEFIQTLRAKEQAKIARAIDLLAEYGPPLGMPHVRRMGGSEDLWELRVPFGGNAYRIFWFPFESKTVVLVHAIHKKSQKTPLREIKTAENRIADFRRQKEGLQ